MNLVRRLPIPVPRRLSSRVWLVSLPSALVSFERRQKVPTLPLGRARYAGVPLIGLGALLALWAWRRESPAGPRLDDYLDRNGDDPSSRLGALSRSPATVAGILVLAGVAVLIRSAVLAAYAAGLAFAARANVITIEEPQPDLFIPGAGRHRNGV